MEQEQEQFDLQMLVDVIQKEIEDAQNIDWRDEGKDYVDGLYFALEKIREILSL